MYEDETVSGAEDDVLLGDDEILMGQDEALLGAARRQLARRRTGSQRALGPTSKPALVYNPSASRPAKIRSYMGMGSTSWTGTDGSDKTLVIEPQENFRAERLIIDVSDSAPPAGQTVLRRIDVGTMPQSASVEAAMPASAFRPDSTYSGLDLQVAQAGVKLQVLLGRTAAPGGVIVTTASVGFFGEWIRNSNYNR